MIVCRWNEINTALHLNPVWLCLLLYIDSFVVLKKHVKIKYGLKEITVNLDLLWFRYYVTTLDKLP